MLAANQGGSAVVNPNIICSIKGDSITTPDQARVKVGDMDVLDNNILNSISETKTFAFDNALGTNTNDALIRADHDRVQAGLVILDSNLLSARVVISAPLILVDRKLAVRACSPRSAACFSRRSLGTLEVKSSLQVDDTGGVILQVVDKLLVVLGTNNLTALATSGASCKALSLGRQSGE
jgi:hypothetical protein